MRAEPLPGLLELLAALYPTVRWAEVSFFAGIPWPYSLVAKGGITLPSGLGRVHVHVAKWDPCSCAGLALLVHEAFHVLQYQQSPGGVGLLHGFALKYVVRAAWEGGAERNKYEKPAYEQEAAFRKACGALPRPLCADGKIDREMRDELLRRNPSLVRRSSR